MTKLHRFLYEYAQQHVADHYLLLEQEEYKGCEEMYEYAMKQLKAHLSAADLEELGKAISALECRSAIEREALYFSGLSMGLSLGRVPG